VRALKAERERRQDTARQERLAVVERERKEKLRVWEEEQQARKLPVTTAVP